MDCRHEKELFIGTGINIIKQITPLMNEYVDNPLQQPLLISAFQANTCSYEQVLMALSSPERQEITTNN